MLTISFTIRPTAQVRRWFCPALVCLTSVLLLTPITRAAEIDVRTRPNIVIFLADDMGIGDTSAYHDWTKTPDNKQLSTPAMEEMARMGVRFMDAHAPASRCSTTRYALLTGRYCWRTSLKQYVLFGPQGDPLIEKDRVGLPDFLKKAGYRTAALGKWHVGLTFRKADGSPSKTWEGADLSQPIADGPLDHGFDTFYGFARSHGSAGPDGMRDNTPDQAIGPGWIEGKRVIGATKNDKQLDGSYVHHEIGAVLDREAMKMLGDAATKTQPFFLYFASGSNHDPYTPCQAIGDMPVAGASKYTDGSRTKNNRCDFIYQNDVQIARLLQFLKKTPDPRRPGKPLFDNTLFIFTSDNGADKPDKAFTGPVRSNKGSLYEGGHREPFIATWPLGGIGDGNAADPGATCDRLLSLTDLFATVAEVLDVPLPPLSGPGRGAEDSVSQLGALRGQTFQPRIAFLPHDHKEAVKEEGPKRAWVAVRSDTCPLPGKWVLLLDETYAYNQNIVAKELYDLATDPMQEKDRLSDPDCTQVVQALKHIAEEVAGDRGSSRQLLSTK